MKLSIITINWNNAEGLRRTLESVAAQTNRNFEHIIIDGGSADGSVDVIKEYESTIKQSVTNDQSTIQIKWVSEKDKGIYNAMNKGIEIASGKRVVNSFNRSELVEDKNKELPEYLLFLNSGDALENAEVVENFYKADIKTDIATGIEKHPNGRLIYPRKEDELCYSYFYNDTLLHQSTFIRRDAFERFGMYNENNRVASDWEWFFRVIIKENASYQPLDFVVADFEGNGISVSPSEAKLRLEESKRVHDAIVPRVSRDYHELKRLQKVEEEYTFLKNGKLGWIVRLLLKMKNLKKGNRRK